MTRTSRHDAWQAGDSYEQYMGRWSRQVAPRFLDWLNVPAGLDWLEVGCGTGALSSAIVDRCAPTSLVSIDPSEGFLATARANVPDAHVAFQVGDAQALPVESASKDVVASASGPELRAGQGAGARRDETRRASGGARIAFYVWDYPGGGMEVMRAFWQAATAFDAGAADLTEDKRFPFCTPDDVCARWSTASGLVGRGHGHRSADRVQGFRRLLAPLHAGRGTSARILREPRA